MQRKSEEPSSQAKVHKFCADTAGREELSDVGGKTPFSSLDWQYLLQVCGSGLSGSSTNAPLTQNPPSMVRRESKTQEAPQPIPPQGHIQQVTCSANPASSDEISLNVVGSVTLAFLSLRISS